MSKEKSNVESDRVEKENVKKRDAKRGKETLVNMVTAKKRRNDKKRR